MQCKPVHENVSFWILESFKPMGGKLDTAILDRKVSSKSGYELATTGVVGRRISQDCRDIRCSERQANVM